MCDSDLVHARELDAACVRAEVGPHPVQGGLDARARVVGVQVVQDEQAGGDLVLSEPAQQRGLAGEVDDAAQPHGIQAHEGANQLLRPLHGPLVPRGAELVEDSLDVG